MAQVFAPFEQHSFFWTIVSAFSKAYKKEGMSVVKLDLDFETKIDSNVTLRFAFTDPRFTNTFRAAQVHIFRTFGYYLVDTTDYFYQYPRLFVNAYSSPYKSRGAHHLQFERAPTECETENSLSLINCFLAGFDDEHAFEQYCEDALEQCCEDEEMLSDGEMLSDEEMPFDEEFEAMIAEDAELAKKGGIAY